MNKNYQHELRECFHGTRGGLALVQQRGRAYLAQLGRAGGLATLLRYGREHLAALARRGAEARWKKAREPHTVTVQWDEELTIVERHVRYWPHQPRRRNRKRPLKVRIRLAPPPAE